MGFLLLLSLVIYSALADYPAVAGDTSQQSATNVIDFRKTPFRSAVEAYRAEPSLDMALITARSINLLRPIPPLKQGINGWEGLHAPGRTLGYHVIIRFDFGASFDDTHIPSSVRLTGSESAYVDSVRDAVNSLVELEGFRAEADPDKADLLIQINLAERLQASEGFTYEKMKRLPFRTTQSSGRSLSMDEYLLPWTFIRVYYDGVDDNLNSSPDIEGGEIWIQFPKRAFWQAEVARIVLDNPRDAIRLGLGATRDEIVRRFRSPHKTELAPVGEALSVRRPRRWVGAGGILDLKDNNAPRPGETLLSLATGIMQAAGGANYLVGVPDTATGQCGVTTHSRILAERLRRAMIMFSGAFEVGALRATKLGDYSREFEADRDHFLADYSLANYQGNFDQRLDDFLAMLAYKESRALNATVKFSERDLYERRGSDLRNAFREIASGFTPRDGGGCINEIEWR